VWYEHRPFVKAIGENPHNGGGVIDEGNDDEQIVIAPCPSSSLISLGGGSRVETAEKNHLRLAVGREGGGGGSRVETDEKNHLWLAFGCEGGGGGSHIETTKMTTSGSHLDAREVVVGVTSKRRK